jgi:hypothetical protein
MRVILLGLGLVLVGCDKATQELVRGERGVWAVRFSRGYQAVIYCKEPKEGEKSFQCVEEERQ